LPAKRYILPKPCPECGLNYGSLRIGIFSGRSKTSVLIRVKHYNPFGYAEIKRKSKGSIIQDKNKLKKEFMKKQQKWCSVRIDKKFALKYEPRVEFYFDEIEEVDTFRKIIHLDWKPGKKFLNAVKKYGWNDFPKYSEKYYRQRDADEITSHIRKKSKKLD